MELEYSLIENIREMRLIAFDFDGVFTNNTVFVSEDGSEAVQCWRGDGIGLQRLREIGMEMVIISTETNPVVSVRSEKLKICCIQNCEDKLCALEAFAEHLNLTLNQVAFVGNDINDLPCLTHVGMPIVVQDAHPDVVDFALYQTRIRGGYGAVREICDLFYNVLSQCRK